SPSTPSRTSSAIPPSAAVTTGVPAAMSDYGTGVFTDREQRMVAAAYRLSGKEEYKNFVIEQLEEMSTWSP
ncbi:MAG: hypothetical protein SNJ70_05135, partial [Armatimonadota bacterium]